MPANTIKPGPPNIERLRELEQVAARTWNALRDEVSCEEIAHVVAFLTAQLAQISDRPGTVLKLIHELAGTFHDIATGEDRN